MIALVLTTIFQKNVLEYFKKVAQAMPVMGFNVLRLELLVLPLVSMNPDDGDPVGAGLMKSNSSGELNVSCVSHHRSRVKNSCIRKYEKSIMVGSHGKFFPKFNNQSFHSF